MDQRVLVVDDCEANRKVAVMMLAKLGVRADTAGNGLEALEAVERVPYCLVLMDCHMPEMDGLAASRELRRREGGRRRLPVIAMTASMGEDIQACLDAGMDGSVAKPARLADLEKILRTWISPVSGEALRRVLDTMGDDPEVLGALVADFAQSGMALCSVMRTAVAEGDWKASSQAAHGLKGASLNFGAHPLAYLCSRLEGMTEAGQATACRAFSDAVAQEFERVRKALGALAATPSGLLEGADAAQ